MTVTKIELDDIETITVSAITENSRAFKLIIKMTDSLGCSTELTLNCVDANQLKKLQSGCVCRHLT